MPKLEIMRSLATSIFLASLILSSIRTAEAKDWTGVYLCPGDDRAVVYLSINESGSALSGYLQVASLNQNSPDGISRVHRALYGQDSGSRLLFNIIGVRDQWTAEQNWTGMIVTVPQPDGQIRQFECRHSSISEVNSAISALNTSGGQLRAQTERNRSTANAQAEYIDSKQRLINDLDERPTDVANLQKARAELAKAISEVSSAEKEVEQKQAIADEKHQEADQANSDAQTTDEHVAASEKYTDYSSAQADVSSARADVSSANADVTSAQVDLSQATQRLKYIDGRIVILKQIMSRDSSLIGQR